MMEKTWRWFGKKDKITLPMLRQIGVEGIVTALHEVPNGEIWTVEAINDLKSYIESYGLRWSVVESLPVCEAIKYAGTEREQLIENYKVSLANLGKCGVKTVCYNFMPVIDWIRTDLQYPWPDGTSSLYYDRIRFAYFDIKILEREGAEKDYTEEELHKVAELDKVITDTEKDNLIDTIIVKTQGFVNGNIKEGDKNPVSIFKLHQIGKSPTQAWRQERHCLWCLHDYSFTEHIYPAGIIQKRLHLRYQINHVIILKNILRHGRICSGSVHSNRSYSVIFSSNL